MRGLRELLTTACAAAVLLAACSRQPEPAGTAPATVAAPAASEPAAPAVEEPPAESGLAIKRGVAMLAQDRATFRPCNEQAELWLLDQTDGVLTQAFGEQMRKGPALLYIEAYGERAPLADDIPEARAYAGTFLLEEVLYAGVQGEVGGCDAPAQDYIVAARGSEPFWSVQVDEAAITWRQSEAPQEIVLGPPQTQDAEGAARYRASGSGHQLDLLIDAQACREPMSGEFFAYAARAVLDGKQFTGCARVGR